MLFLPIPRTQDTADLDKRQLGQELCGKTLGKCLMSKTKPVQSARSEEAGSYRVQYHIFCQYGVYRQADM